MIKRKRKKTVEQVIPVETIEEIVPVEEVEPTAEVIDNVIIEDATVEEVTAKIVVEEKPRRPRKKKEEATEVAGPIELESFVSLIKPEDYLGNAVEPKNVYKVHAIHGDKVTLKEKGIIVFATKISNLKRVK